MRPLLKPMFSAQADLCRAMVRERGIDPFEAYLGGMLFDADCPPDAVRVCLGGPVSRAECDDALRLIAETLAHPLRPDATVR